MVKEDIPIGKQGNEMMSSIQFTDRAGRQDMSLETLATGAASLVCLLKSIPVGIP